MTVTVIKKDGNTTFRYEETKPSEELDPKIEMRAKYNWNLFGLTTQEVGEEIVLKDFDKATNQEKLDAIDRRLKDLGKKEADTQEVDDDKATLNPTKHEL